MKRSGRRYGRWMAVPALVILGLIMLDTTVLDLPNEAAGIAPGGRLAPFAAPLVTGDLQGAVNVTLPDEGSKGPRPACTVRGPQILNVCQLYEQGPVVLALFVDEGGCEGVLDDMQRLVSVFPGVRFAAVSIKGDVGQLRALVRSHRLSFPVGIDREGVLASLYKLASCPQITFAYPGGIVQSRALLVGPPFAVLRTRVSELVAAADRRAAGASGERPS
jgi:hypothetical protein